MVLLIAAAFVVPMVGATLLYQLAPEWRPFGTVNHGDLVTPPRALSVSGLTDQQGRVLADDFLHGRWTVIVFAAPDCGWTCQASLYKTRQSRIALNRDMGRVQRVLVLPAGHTPGIADLLLRHPDLRIAEASAGWLRQLSTAAPQTPASGSVYVVDPRGYLMMRYGPDATAEGILKDLKRLLRLSRIG